MLAFTVFFWGLHYKLSLYRSEATQHRQAAAKLLSQKERPLAGIEIDRLVLHGLTVPVTTRRLSATSVAALPANGNPAPGRSESSVEPQETPVAVRFRHLTSSGPRGPPTTV
jgi:hypothetical protein